MSSLSLCQLSSHELLREWLNARCEDTDLDVEARAAQTSFQRESNAEAGESTPHSYHYRLARLLSFEFSYPAEGTPVALFTAELQQFRRDAALYASCHRVATRCFFSLAAFPERDSKPPGHLCRPPYGASIDPCSWLERRDRAYELPFYLWDVKRKQTMRVKAIIATSEGSLEYVAISHTVSDALSFVLW